MNRLYYVRHGESFINTGKTWSDKPGSENDLGLTETGKAQVEQGALQLQMQAIAPDLIVSSPLARAAETAAIFARTLAYPTDSIIYDNLFLEIQVGELEGMSYAEFITHYTYADLGKFEGAETIEQLQQRAAQAFSFVQARPEATILVVSHSCFGRAFIRHIEGRPYTDEFVTGKNISLPYGEPLALLPKQ